MPTVYLLEGAGKRFHKDPGCWQLSSPRGGRRTPVAIDLSKVEMPIPCRTCYPDFPVAESVHVVCTQCHPQGPARPCSHNGGVPVYQARKRRKQTWVSDPGDTWYVKRYVWPETAYLYTTAS